MHIWTNPEIKLLCFNNLKMRFVQVGQNPKIDVMKTNLWAAYCSGARTITQ
jgi:hypothetical protein